jgi:hypothetical protein
VILPGAAVSLLGLAFALVCIGERPLLASPYPRDLLWRN